MSGDDGAIAKVQLLQFVERPGVFAQVGERKITELFLENAAGVQDLFARKVDENIIRCV